MESSGVDRISITFLCYLTLLFFHWLFVFYLWLTLQMLLIFLWKDLTLKPSLSILCKHQLQQGHHQALVQAPKLFHWTMHHGIPPFSRIAWMTFLGDSLPLKHWEIQFKLSTIFINKNFFIKIRASINVKSYLET